MEAGRRDLQPVVYCVVPAELADELHELLRAFYRDDPLISVVIERRGSERRRVPDRRQAAQGPLPSAGERRKLRASSGRRITERRAAQVPTRWPSLPSRALPYSDQITFVERLEPSLLEREDADTARLIERIQAGEGGLFDQVYMRYFDRVYAYLKVTLHDSHDAEDVTQDVFIRVLEALPRYERRASPFRAWMFRIVRNSAINRIRQRQRVIVEPSEGVSERAALDGMPASDSLRWLSDQNLLALIEELPLSQRQVIVLRYMMEFRSGEIGTILDRSPDAVRQLHQRAMRALRQKLGETGRDEDCEHTRVQRESMLRLSRPAPVLSARRMSLR